MQVSIVNYSQIDKKVFRIEAEFYASNSLLNIDCFTGDEIIALEQYNSIYGLNSNGKGYPVLRMNEFHDIFTGKANQHSENFSDDDFCFYSLNKGDILICRTNGNPKLVGKSALVAKDYPYVYESHLFKIRTDSNLVTPETLVVYLNTFYGKLEIEKFSMQGNQANFSLAKFKEMKIPKFSKKFNRFIEHIVNSSFDALSNSERSYQQAETILLSELRLTNWQPKHQLTFIKNYSDTKRAGRIDAEYYQPKYDDIIKEIKNYSGGCDTLENLCEEIGHPSNPPYADSKDTNKTFIVTQKHLGNYCLADDYWKSEDAKYTTDEFVYENKQFVLQKEDLVLYTVGGPPHIGKANLIFETDVSSTIGSFVTLVRARKEQVNPYYLLALFNSFIGYQLTNKFMRGMVQQYIYPKDLAKTVIPILPKAKQTQIQKKITESFRLRQQSKRLLESAKKAVEIAIEQDEQTAIKQLKKVI